MPPPTGVVREDPDPLEFLNADLAFAYALLFQRRVALNLEISRFGLGRGGHSFAQHDACDARIGAEGPGNAVGAHILVLQDHESERNANGAAQRKQPFVTRMVDVYGRRDAKYARSNAPGSDQRDQQLRRLVPRNECGQSCDNSKRAFDDEQ